MKLSTLDEHSLLYFSPPETRLKRIERLRALGIAVYHDDYGAPKLERPGYHISITHTSSLQIIMIHSAPCGIDCEQADRKISEHIEAMLGAKGQDALRRWTEREAYAKMTGHSLRACLRQTPSYAGLNLWHIQGLGHLGTLISTQPIKTLRIIHEHPLKEEISIRPEVAITCN